jgi:hypothetical protein
MLHYADYALDKKTDLQVSTGNNDVVANPLERVCASSLCILRGGGFSTFCEMNDISFSLGADFNFYYLFKC